MLGNFIKEDRMINVLPERRSIHILVALLVFVAGCYHVPSPQELASADYGRYPDNYSELIKTCLDHALKDPMSAQISFTSAPVKGWLNKPVPKGGGIEAYGYWIDATVNAKNSYGGYTGSYPYRFFINNGWVGSLCKTDSHGQFCAPCYE